MTIDIICRKIGADLTSLNGNKKLEMIKQGEEQIKAMQIIMNSDCDKYGSLIGDYDQLFLSGNNNYPKTPLEAYNLLKGANKTNPRVITESLTEWAYPSTPWGMKNTAITL